MRRGGRERKHLRVRRGVLAELTLVVRCGDDFASSEHDCSDRHITVGLGGVRLADREVHRLFGFHSFAPPLARAHTSASAYDPNAPDRS